MTVPQLRYLSRQDVLAAGGGDWTLAVGDVRAALALLAAGDAEMVAESVLPIGPGPLEKAYGLPASLGGNYDAVGLKWAVHRAAAAADLPSTSNFTLLNRRSDGRPLGLVESAHLTRMRTAAVSALAMQTLQSAPPAVVALLGAGEQAKAHLAMLGPLFPATRQIRAWARRPDAAKTLVAGTANALVCDTLAAALENADVVLCCTSAATPILDPDAVRPDRLIVQAGFNEASFDTIAASDVVAVDLWGDFAENSAKSLFQMYRAGRFRPTDVAVDLGALAAGKWTPIAGQSRYFSSFGLNLFDIALAARVLADAEAAQIGTLLPIF